MRDDLDAGQACAQQADKRLLAAEAHVPRARGERDEVAAEVDAVAEALFGMDEDREVARGLALPAREPGARRRVVGAPPAHGVGRPCRFPLAGEEEQARARHQRLEVVRRGGEGRLDMGAGFLDLAEGDQRLAELGVGRGAVGLARQDLARRGHDARVKAKRVGREPCIGARGAQRGREPEREVEMGERGLWPLELVEQGPVGVAQLGVRRREGEGVGGDAQRLRLAAEALERRRELDRGPRRAGTRGEGAAIGEDRVLVPASVAERVAQVVVDVRVVRVQRAGALEMPGRLVAPAQRTQGHREVVEDAGVLGRPREQVLQPGELRLAGRAGRSGRRRYRAGGPRRAARPLRPLPAPGTHLPRACHALRGRGRRASAGPSPGAAGRSRDDRHRRPGCS
jgi:hypothetical protein